MLSFKRITMTMLVVLFPTYTFSANIIPEQVKANVVVSNYAETKYPVVFAHGTAGYARIGPDFLGVDYWYQILPDLARNGGNIWPTQVSPFNSNEIRGEQLVGQVEEIIAITGKAKVNLIGHSQGGFSVRYVNGVMPDKIASVTTVASPITGSTLADFFMNIKGTIAEKPFVGLIQFVGNAISFASTLDKNTFPHDPMATLESLTIAGAKRFNQRFSAGVPSTQCGNGQVSQNGTYFYSFGGTGVLTNPLDLPDYLLLVTAATRSDANDGFVMRCETHFGQVIRDNHNWNHMDATNQFFGLRAFFSADPVQVYREHLNRLKNKGL